MTETSVDPHGFRPFEVTAVHLIYVGLGFFIVLFGMFSLFIKERLYLGEAPLAAIFGIIVGPACLNLFNPSGWANNRSGAPGGEITDEISLEVLRVTIALSVFAVGVELPKKYLLRHWRSIAFLLGPVMIWGWLVTAAFMYALIPGLDFLNSLVVASCVTPTDPILAQAVVGGPWAEKHVPAHLRHILMCESGCNDGAAFPFLYLALFLTTNRDNRGKAIAEWFYDAWAYQIIFGTLLGALIGWAARKLMRFSERHKLVDRESFVAQYVSLAIASMGVNVLLGSDDLLAAFACGSAFAWDGWFTKQTEDSNFSSIVDLLFNVAVFIFIGSLMPFQDWVGGTAEEPNTLTLWRLFVLAICVLLTKRLPIVVALWRWIPDIKTFREAIFAGHFGPIGVGAIFIATLARTELPEHVPSPPESSNDVLALVVQPVIYFFVICSIAVHGLTIPFFAFSKGASRMTRTWSRNPSFAFDTEPNWVSRIRSKRTGDGLTAEEGNMTEIERVLNAQLRTIGRGAIGGEAEKDLSRSATQNGSGSRSGASDSDDVDRQDAPKSVRTPGEKRDHDVDADYFASPDSYDPQNDDWGGEDTAEVRRYREKQRAKKESEYAQLRQKQQSLDEEKRQSHESKQNDHAEGDIGAQQMLDEERGPMDRDMPKTEDEKKQEKQRAALEDGEENEKNRRGMALWGSTQVESSSSSTSSARQEREHAKVREDCEEHYPKSRSWVEGDKLVIEYQKSRLSEVECHTMPIMESERSSILDAEAPAYEWAMQHADALQHYAGLENVRSWSPREALHNLVHHSIPQRYAEALHRKRGRRPSASESKEERDARFQALYGGMEYASQHRRDDDDDENNLTLTKSKGSSTRRSSRRGSDGDTFVTVDSRNSRARKTKEPKVPRERTPSPPVIGWLAPRPAPRRRMSTRGTSSPNRSISPSSLNRPGMTIRFAPREHKLASDARRRSTTKKVLAGRATLRPISSRLDEAVKEEVIEPPKDTIKRTGVTFERSSSAGGLGPSTPSSGGLKDNPIRSLFSARGEGTRFGAQRTDTVSSSGSGNRTFTVRSARHGGGTSQWVDVADNAPSDLARVGGGISRPASRRSSPTRKATNEGSEHDAGRSEIGFARSDSLDVSTDDQSQHGSQSSSRARNRLSSLLSSITPHATHSQRHPARAADRGRPTRISTPLQPVIRENAPSPAIVMGPRGPAETGGSILNDSSSSSVTGSQAVLGTSTTSNAAQKDNRQDDNAPERGVTFNL